MMAFIGPLSPEGIILGDHFDSIPTIVHYIEIKPDACRFFDYVETKDLKGESEASKQYLAEHHGIASLSIVLNDKTRLSLFEQAERLEKRYPSI